MSSKKSKKSTPIIFRHYNIPDNPEGSFKANRFLYILASSAPVRLFRISGKTFHHNQCCLTDKRFQ